MTHDLAGQIALIPGGSGGLGRAVTLRLLADGAQVVVPYMNEGERATLEAVATAYGEALTLERADLSREEEAQSLVARSLAKHGRLDILACVVGGYLGGKNVEQTTLEEWHSQFRLNLDVPFIVCRAVLPTMRSHGYGRIIAVSSRSAARISPGVSAYTASKAALQALISAIAEESRGTGITANAVLPSVIDTAANRAAMPKADHAHWPKPEQIAAVIRFLASRESELISGAMIPVYGDA